MQHNVNAWVAYSILLVGSFITVEAAAFQLPALPVIARFFDVQEDDASLITLLYYVGLVAFSPVFGRVADSYGRKRVLVSGLFAFAISEFAAALAPSYSALLLARFMQGLSVACILPMLLSYANALFPPEKRGMPLGALAATMSFGAASGAVIGGVLIDHFGWRSIYWISGFLSLIGLVLILWRVPETHTADIPYKVDISGSILLLIAVGGFLLAPSVLGNFGIFSIVSWIPIGIAVTSCLILWKVENIVESPIIQTSLLRERAFILPGVIYFLFLICYGGTIYSLVFYVGNRPGGSASQTGFITMVSYTSSIIAALVCGRLVDKFSERILIFFVIALMALGLALYGTIRFDTSLWTISMIVMLLGFAQGMKGPAITKMALKSVPEKYTSSGSGLFSMFRDFGTPSGVSIGLALFAGVKNKLTEKELIETALEKGVSKDNVSLLKGAISGDINDYPGLSRVLEAEGIRFSQLLRESQLEGLSSVLTAISAFLLIVLGVTFLLSLKLPKRVVTPLTLNGNRALRLE